MRTILYSLLGTLITGGGAYLWYRLRTRTETEAMRERAQISADQTPLQVLQKALEGTQAQLREQQAQLYTFINNHLAHDKAEREHLAEVLSGIQQEQRVNVETLRELANDMKAHRDESAAGRGKIHESINDLRLAVAEIKGGLPRQ